MIKGFKNCNIYVYGKGIINTSLEIKSGKIHSIGEAKEDFLTLDSKYYVIPGFVDKHIHGANHTDFMNSNLESIRNITKAIAQEGTTSCLATTMTQSKEEIKASLKNIAKYMASNPEGPEVLGVHLEGPFISKKRAGAQPLEYIIPCDIETFDDFNASANGAIKQVTLACEENGLAFIRHLVKKGIVASIGHSNSDYETLTHAVNNGATSVTHMFNAMTPFHHRDVGVVGGAFLENKLSCELVCDLIHVSAPAVKILHQNKGSQNICLITDSIEAKYMPDGKFQLGGQDVFVKNDEARLENGTLAGSTLKMNKGVYNFKKTLGISMTEAIDCATINPAKCIHVENRKGSIEIGKDADLVVVDEHLNVYMTICRGEVVYSKF